jgi:hypothetical protein
MSVHDNQNNPEQPLPVKLMNGYLEQADLFGPALVRAAQEYRDAGISIIRLARATVLGAVERTGRKPPFINTMADAAEGALSSALKFQGAVVEAGVKAHRRAAQSVLDAMTGKTLT